MHHDSQIDNFKVVALQNDADNVFSDIVYVPFDRCHQDFAIAAGLPLGLLSLNERLEVGDGLFHDSSGLYDLGQKHLALTKEVSHDIHAIHQRAFNDLNGFGSECAGLLGIGFNVGGYSFDEGVF